MNYKNIIKFKIYNKILTLTSIKNEPQIEQIMLKHILNQTKLEEDPIAWRFNAGIHTPNRLEEQFTEFD